MGLSIGLRAVAAEQQSVLVMCGLWGWMGRFVRLYVPLGILWSLGVGHKSTHASFLIIIIILVGKGGNAHAP